MICNIVGPTKQLPLEMLVGHNKCIQIFYLKKKSTLLTLFIFDMWEIQKEVWIYLAN